MANRRQILVVYLAPFFSYNDSTKQLTQAKRVSVDRWEEENELHIFSKNNFAFLLHNTFHNRQNKNFNAV